MVVTLDRKDPKWDTLRLLSKHLKKGWALLISTPRGKGWFCDMSRRGQDKDDEEHESWNLLSWPIPTLDCELIEQEREKLPERVFRQEYSGEFIEGEGAVFRYIRERASGQFQEPEKGTTEGGGLSSSAPGGMHDDCAEPRGMSRVLTSSGPIAGGRQAPA